MSIFAWVRSRGATFTMVQPVVLHQPDVGPKLEFVGDTFLMKPHEHGMSMAELIEIYPAPEVKPE